MIRLHEAPSDLGGAILSQRLVSLASLATSCSTVAPRTLQVWFHDYTFSVDVWAAGAGNSDILRLLDQREHLSRIETIVYSRGICDHPTIFER